MNIYAVIILLALLVNYAINLISDLLNLRALDKQLPEEFKDVFDEEKYRKSQEYTRVRTRFGLITSTFSLAVLLIFWFAGGFNWVDQFVREAGYGTIVTGLMFMGILFAAQYVISIPFSIYSTFVIEERFGFNKTTPSTFVTDRIKGLGLTLLLGAPLLAGIIAIFEYLGAIAWLYAWIVIIVYSLVVQFIAPTWIMPIFNKFTPLEDGELKQAILDYARKVSFPLQGIYKIDGSRRSSKSNAFFTGFGKNKRIALFDTLIENHTVPELVAVLAHEVGHYKKKHIPQNMITGFLQTGVMLYLLSLFIQVPGLHEAFFMQDISVYAGLLFFGLLYSPIEMVLSVIMQMFSRKHEFEADRFAAETTGDPESMVSVLKKLSADNLSNLTPHPFHVFLNYSHPPVLQRIRAIRSAAS
ncbi:M48 family metallopeptidase [Natronogracilivirga saccharolytica]|uniref:M48 family metallopeptidase n=1 Tax=Natronogracilivirga saccharolytica TaxID=2812953 RepID=A0A8J7UVK9_9BACT|nr:M48 family metallopeptidase [Natronogracilivirga saccharolytica]MBP3193565.1 M48 family metallopeptidase [Natronogracilivirga saccharolytica]